MYKTTAGSKRIFAALLALCFMLALVPVVSLEARAAGADVYVPLDIASGYTADIVVEGGVQIENNLLTHAATYFDGDNSGANTAMYAKGLQIGDKNGDYGLPDNGVLIFSHNSQEYKFQLGPYNANNAVQVSRDSDQASPTSGSFVFRTPGAFSKISILGAAGNGDVVFDAVVKYTDGTSTTSTFTAPNWATNDYCDVGRIKIKNVAGESSPVVGEFDDYISSLYHFEVNTDVTKLIKEIEFTHKSDNGGGAIARANLMAVSGCIPAGAPTTPEGVAVSNSSDDGFTITWSEVTGATKYAVDISTESDFSTLVGTCNNLSVTDKSLNIGGLAADTSYYVRVRAVNDSGQSQSSTAATGKTTNNGTAPNYTLVYDATTGKFHKNATSGNEVMMNGMTVSADGKTITLDDFNFVTSASPAMTFPDGVTLALVDGSTNSITSSSNIGIQAGENLTISGDTGKLIAKGTVSGVSATNEPNAVAKASADISGSDATTENVTFANGTYKVGEDVAQYVELTPVSGGGGDQPGGLDGGTYTLSFTDTGLTYGDSAPAELNDALNAQKASGANDPGWGDTKTWYIADNTLYLNNFNFTTTAATAFVTSPNTVISLAAESENSITGGDSNDENNVVHTIGLHMLGDLTFKGTGKLTVNGGKVGSEGRRGTYAYGLLYENGTLKFTESAEVIVVGGANERPLGSDAQTCGLQTRETAKGSLIVEGNAKASFTAGKANASSFGIGLPEEITLSVTGGKLTGIGGDAHHSSLGISLGRTTITGGEVLAKAGTASRDSVGIALIDSFKLSGAATLTAIGNTTTDETGDYASVGCDFIANCQIEDTAKIIASGNDYAARFIDVYEISLDLSNIAAKGGMSSSESAALTWATDEMLIHYLKTASGGEAKYAVLTAKSGNSGNTGGNTGGGSTTPTTPTTPGTGDSLVIVDGKPIDAGTVTVDKESSETITVVNQNVIEKQIDTAKDNVTIIVPIAAESNTATAELVVKNIDDMAKDDMTLTVQVGGVQYDLPTTAVDTAAIMAALGTDDPAEAPISISITMTVDTATQKLVDAAIADFDGEVVFPPMQFTITASYKGETVDVSEFAAYVSRTVEITAEQAARITTAVVVDPDGTTRQVPTNVYQKGGKWYAEINSLTNSTYVLIYNELTFADAEGKWYEAYVNEMGSRKIIAGVGDNLFAGERSITRAEFAAIIVRALGLPTKSGDAFTDVASTAWYADAVNTAYSYGLISGVGDGRYEPTRSITRQEAMIILQKAANIAAFTGRTSHLDSFKDAAEVASWAEDAAKFCVGSGLVSGYDGNLNPTDDISRAETATIILRLMQEAGLIDKRS